MSTEYFTAVSLDGYVADRHGGLDWLTGLPGTPAKRDRFAAFFAGVGAMAMGATTYEWVLAHEPDAWRRYYGDTPCWVFTHRELPVPDGADVRFVTGDVRVAHEAMRAAAARIWLVGGGALAAARRSPSRGRPSAVRVSGPAGRRTRAGRRPSPRVRPSPGSGAGPGCRSASG
ncbi:MAG TPA: dihydrofolate reductase family protein [Actinocatenispora sp.]